MARGWESKSVEAQIEESRSNPSADTEPAASPEERQALSRRNDLLLSRQRILEQLERSSNERYSEMLRRSLAAVDVQLAKLR